MGRRLLVDAHAADHRDRHLTIVARPVRVVTACHYYPPHIGGIEVVAAALAASAAEAGHEVVVLTSRAGADHSGATARGGGAGARRGGATAPDGGPAGVTVLRLPAWNGLEERAGIPYPLFGVRFARAAWREVGTADVVHLHDVFYLCAHLVALCAWVRRKPLVVTQHVGVVDHPSRAVVALQRLLYATVGAVLFRRARAVVAYNATVAATVRRVAPGARLVEVRNGVDVEVFRPVEDDGEKRRLRARYGLPVERPVALYVGRLVAKKGYDVVHAARCPDHLTVFVGGGRPLVASDDDAVFAGAVDRATLADYYRMSDVFVLPAVGEPFTLAMQEAMACGLPVVTADDPGYVGARLDRRGVRLVARTPTAVRAAVAGLLADPEGRAAGGAWCRRYALDHFTWESNVGAVLGLYDEAVSAGRPSLTR